MHRPKKPSSPQRRQKAGHSACSACTLGDDRTPGPLPAVPADPRCRPEEVTVVCVGAAAGLDPLLRLLRSLPRNTAAAFVVVLRQPVDGGTLVPSLARHTSLHVRELSGDTVPAPGVVYVAPPGRAVAFGGDIVSPVPPRASGRSSRPLDRSFSSLAEARGARAVGVLLSGTGADGARGVGAIADAGGTVFSQAEPVPPGGILLSPEGIARVFADVTGGYGGSPALDRSGMDRIFSLVRDAVGVDLSGYKQTTLGRRVLRRLLLKRFKTLSDYVRCLEGDPDEVRGLFHDMLINVTGYFRDPDVFDLMKERVFPALLRGRRPDDPVRIWVPGCSSGEEVYSIAIALLEHFEDAGASFPFQIFATDISETVLKRARCGRYGPSVGSTVSPERLERFFSRDGDGYRIDKSIRSRCVFVKQNVAGDPPFSRIDIVSCRNLLIYLSPDLQKKVLDTFCYALKPEGFLLLGSSETIAGLSSLLVPVDKKHKVFVRGTGSIRPRIDFHACGNMTQPCLDEGGEPVAMNRKAKDDHEMKRTAEDLLFDRYVPAAVVVDRDLDAVQFRGDLSPYLSPASGRASLNLTRILRRELALDIKTLVHQAKNTGEAASRTGMCLRGEHGPRALDVEVVPLKGAYGDTGHFLIVFRSAGLPLGGVTLPAGDSDGDAAGQVRRLESELVQTKEHLQAVIDEKESATEELKLANEEVQSSNEELRSTNEELETSKEELQSANEELTTVNEELQARNLELGQLNSDLGNLLASIDMPIVMLDADLRVRRYTPPAERLLNLMPGDVGRAFGAVRHRLEADDLDSLVAEVMETRGEVRREVRDTDGCWYYMKARPYVTRDGSVDGAVLAFMNIDALKQSEEAVRDSEQRYRALFDLAGDAIILYDMEAGAVSDFNESACRNLGYTRDEFRRLHPADLFLGEGAGSDVAGYLRDLVSNDIDTVETRQRTKEGGRRTVQLKLRPLVIKDREYALFVGRDITDLRDTQLHLFRQQQAYKSLSENSPDIICRWDRELRYTYAGPGVLEVVGSRPEKVIGKTVREVLSDGALAARFEGALRETVGTRRQAALEFSLDLPSGTRHFHSILVPERGDGEEVVSVLGITRDITDMRNAERALAASEARLNAFFSDSPVAMGILDESFRYVRANGVTERYVGVPMKRLTGRSVSQLLPSYGAALSGPLRRVLETGEPVQNVEISGPMKGAGGKTVDWLASFFPVMLEEGRRGVGFVGVDITERKRVQEDLSEQKRVFQTLTENSPDVIARYDRRLRYIYISPSVQQVTGMSPDAFVGRTNEEAGMPEGPREVWSRTLRRVLRTKRPASAEFVFPARDCERSFHYIAVPEFSENGTVVSVMAIARDVTDMKRLQEQLEDGRRKLQAVLDSAPVGIVVADASASVVMANRMAESLYARPVPYGKDVDSHRVFGLCHPDGTPYRPADLPLTRSARRGEVFRDLEMGMVLPGGERRDLLVNTVPLKDGKGTVTGAVGAFSDITTIKASEAVLRRDKEALERLVNEKTAELLRTHMELENIRRISDIGVLAATIAHEIRNPLAAIRTAAYNVRRKGDAAVIGGHLDTIDKKVMESNQIIQNLLSYSRIKTPKCEPVPVVGLVRECVEAVQSRYSRWDVDLGFSSRLGDGCMVEADPVHLKILFGNILDNAYHALSDRQGSVGVEVRRRGDMVEFVVRDSGCGIERADLPRIFEPFFTRKSRGTGLGLTVCRQIAELHNGGIRVRSVRGRGTTFIVSIPLQRGKAGMAS